MLKGKSTVLRDKETSEPDSNITQMLRLLDRESKVTLITMWRTSMGKVDIIQEKMDNVNRDNVSRESWKRIKKKMLNTAIKTKNAFDEVINRQDIANERISDLKGRPIEKSQLKWKEKKKEQQQQQQNIQELWDNYNRCNICVMEIPEGEYKRNRIEDIFKIIWFKHSKIYDRK